MRHLLGDAYDPCPRDGLDGDGVGDTCEPCPNDSANDIDGDEVCGDGIGDACPGP